MDRFTCGNRRLGMFLIVILVAGFLTTVQAQVQITEGFSGTWYERDTSGQGFTVQVLDSDSVVLTWYTFDLEGEQFWLQAVGDIQGNQMHFDDLMRVRGPQFGPGYDSDDREWIPAGSLTLTFESCMDGIAEYSGSAELPPDDLDITRLTHVAGYGCDHDSPELSAPIYPGLSGIWYERASSGQGWMVELLDDDSALLYWFTQDLNGEQMWLLGVADRVGNGFVAQDMDRPHGASFGPGFDKDDVIREDWGQVSISFVGCDHAVVSYQAVGDEGRGWYRNVVALAPIGYADTCAFPGGLGSLSGGLSVATQSWVDGDTNDPNSEYVPNDVPAEVQEVGNPATITGFAAAEPVGYGRFENEIDEIDAFQLPLIAGQSLQLVIADWIENDPLANDLDVWVFEAGDPSQPIYAAETIARNEFIQVQESGIYDVIVYAYAGASAYTLHASYAPVPAQAQQLSSLGDFVEGEILVGLPDVGTIPSPIPPVAPQQIAGERGLELVADSVMGPRLFRLPDSGLAPAGEGGSSSDPHPLVAAGWQLGSAADHGRQDLVREIKSLQGDSDIKYAHPNYHSYAMATGNDPMLPSQWHYNQINVPQAWDITQGDDSVLVAVIDSGVAPHSDLEANVRRDLGFDFANYAANIYPPFGYIGDDLDGDGYHGTHVAGTVGAVLNNGVYGAGVAPQVEIMPLRSLGLPFGGTDFAVANAIRWAAGQSNVSGFPNPSRAADVINMSLGSTMPQLCSPTYQQAIDYARSQGIVIITAAGNANSSLMHSPASCSGVVNVSAVNRDLVPAFYSNCGGTIDVAAPGGETRASDDYEPGLFPPSNAFACRENPFVYPSETDGVLSTVLSGTPRLDSFRGKQGTSMAAPHVAGVAALMRSVDPALSPADFDAMLAAGALTDDYGPPGWDREYGHGLIDARKAVEAALGSGGGGTVPAALTATPAQLNFGELQQTRTVTIERQGGGSGSVSGFTGTASWLSSAAPLDVDGNGYGTYEIGVDRSGLVEGQYQGNLQVQTSDGLALDIAVAMQVGEAGLEGQAGFLYLTVIDAVTGSLVRLLGGSSDSGQYAYAVEGLVPGEYLLVATSDVNFDGVICGWGEYCGYYPGTGPVSAVVVEPGGETQVQSLTVFPDRTGLGESSAMQLLSIGQATSSGMGNPRAGGVSTEAIRMQSEPEAMQEAED